MAGPLVPLTETSITNRAFSDSWAIWGDEEGLSRVLGAAIKAPTGEPKGEAGIARLRQAHGAWARPDYSRIHPSWFIRALRDESQAVRRVIARDGPPEVAMALRREYGWDHDALQGAAPPLPEAIAVVRSLWSERLVGGPPPSDDDPPVIRALSELSADARDRLIARLGLAKLAYDPDALPEVPWSEGRSARFRRFQADWGQRDPRLIQVARWDAHPFRQQAATDTLRLGLVTVARLLELADPHRARWALQHLPYNVARFLGRRKHKGALPVPIALSGPWERALWRLAVPPGSMGPPEREEVS